MSLQGGGLCFILLCYFLAASTNVIHENISTEEVKIDQWQTLSLLCNATEVPGATVVWRREDSSNITLRSKYEYKYVKKEFSTIEGDPLNLTFIQGRDRGVYICTASNSVDPSVRKRFIVNVDYAPYIETTRWHDNAHALLGEDVTLQCLFKAQPRGTNTWTSQRPGTKYNVIESNFNEVIVDERRSDVVQCNAWEGQTVILKCNREQYTWNPRVTWSRLDGRNITIRNAAGETLEVETLRNATLTFWKIHRYDMGNYSCAVRNPPFNDSFSKNFIINVHFKPELTTSLSHWPVNASLGEDAIFSCKIAASPRSTNTWKIWRPVDGSLTGFPLTNSSKYVMEETELDEFTTLMQLTIRNVEPEDYTMYSCSAANRFGSHGVINALRNQSSDEG